MSLKSFPTEEGLVHIDMKQVGAIRVHDDGGDYNDFVVQVLCQGRWVTVSETYGYEISKAHKRRDDIASLPMTYETQYARDIVSTLANGDPYFEADGGQNFECFFCHGHAPMKQQVEHEEFCLWIYARDLCFPIYKSGEENVTTEDDNVRNRPRRGQRDEVEIYRRSDGKLGWRRRSQGNNEIIATDGGQGYENIEEVTKMAHRVNGPRVRYTDELGEE